MDESISKALIMVAGVLLALIVIAFVTFSFGQMGIWATVQDDEVLTEQTNQFNREYEAYGKDLMYGVDVISCLNKALSDNEKITNNAVINGEKYDKAYEVKVKVTLTNNKPLEESIVISYRSNDGKEFDYSPNDGPVKTTGVKYKIKDLKDMKKSFNFLSKDYKNITSFKENDDFVTRNEICDELKNISEFNITREKNGINETITRELLSVADTVSETIRNTDSKTNSTTTGWTKAVFKSALYDMKTRKFKCTNIEYSAETGRVNYIEFKEI